jgi:hypothetical protein
MIKPQLTSSAEAAFSKWILKVNRILISLIILTRGALFVFNQNKTIKKLLQQSNPISNLQLGKDNGVLFYTK